MYSAQRRSIRYELESVHVPQAIAVQRNLRLRTADTMDIPESLVSVTRLLTLHAVLIIVMPFAAAP
jgi:hypothetical protein